MHPITVYDLALRDHRRAADERVRRAEITREQAARTRARRQAPGAPSSTDRGTAT